MKTVIQSLISHMDNDNTGDIEINFLADKKLEAEWTEIKKGLTGSHLLVLLCL